MRSAFIKWLCDKAEKDASIVLLTADLGFSVVEQFAERFPDRFINVGVAEQNMVGIAAGMASEGMKPFTYSIGIFPTFRCAEQLRNDIDYHNLPVITCMAGSGVTYGALGYSHHAVQDIALMRTLPNTMIGCPASPYETLAILDWHYINPCPLYLRLHKAGDPEIHSASLNCEPGQWVPLTHFPESIEASADTCILTIGFLGHRVCELAVQLGIPYPIFSLPLWGQASRNSQRDYLRRYKHIITVEDHLLDGGFGSWQLENASIFQCQCKITAVTLPLDTVGQVACESTLIKSLLNRLIEVVALPSSA